MIAVAAVTKSLLPALIAGRGTIIVMGSTAGQVAYEGGGGYVAAKHGAKAVVDTLRLELWDQPVRVTEIAPGMVQSEGFALTRFGGDQAKADAVYAGARDPSPPTTSPTSSRTSPPAPRTSTSTASPSAPAPKPPNTKSSASSSPDRLAASVPPGRL